MIDEDYQRTVIFHFQKKKRMTKMVMAMAMGIVSRSSLERKRKKRRWWLVWRVWSVASLCHSSAYHQHPHPH